MKKEFWRAINEAGFIIFFFYSNLLMGVFERSGSGQGKNIAWAVRDIFTFTHFSIALIGAFVGYVFFRISPKEVIKTYPRQEGAYCCS